MYFDQLVIQMFMSNRFIMSKVIVLIYKMFHHVDFYEKAAHQN